jgi:hypothetical protein
MPDLEFNADDAPHVRELQLHMLQLCKQRLDKEGAQVRGGQGQGLHACRRGASY